MFMAACLFSGMSTSILMYIFLPWTVGFAIAAAVGLICIGVGARAWLKLRKIARSQPPPYT
jgi:hypothetical protein